MHARFFIKMFGSSLLSYEIAFNKSKLRTLVIVGWKGWLVRKGGGHSGPKSWCTVPLLNKAMKMDKSMSKLLTKL